MAERFNPKDDKARGRVELLDRHDTPQPSDTAFDEYPATSELSLFEDVEEHVERSQVLGPLRKVDDVLREGGAGGVSAEHYRSLAKR